MLLRKVHLRNLVYLVLGMAEPSIWIATLALLLTLVLGRNRWHLAREDPYPGDHTILIQYSP